MSQMTLLSGSAGTFWGLTGGNEWTRLLLTEASSNRVTDQAGTPNTVVSSFSDDGKTNTATIEDVVANLATGGTTSVANRAATCFVWPIFKPDGEPLNVGNDQFTIDFVLEIVQDGGNDQNRCFVGLGINGGDIDYSGGRAAALIVYNSNNTAINPRIASIGGGSGATISNAGGLKYIKYNFTSSPTGEFNPFQHVSITAYDDSNERINTRQLATQQFYLNSPSLTSRPTDQAHAFITLGKQNTGAAGAGGAKTFKFKAFYKVSLHTQNDAPSSRPD